MPVSYTEISSSEDIYDVLVADSTFMGFIGTIQFQAGTETALLVAVAENPLEDIISASGVLCVIEKYSSFQSVRFLGPEVYVDQSFSMRLTQFPSEPLYLRAAVERLLHIFPGGYANPLGAADEVAGQGQYFFQLPKWPVACVE